MANHTPAPTAASTSGSRDRLDAQFARFLLVGGSATAIQYVILVVLHQFLGLAATPASAIGFALSAGYNFLASYHYTFRGRTPLRAALPRYALVVGIGLVINTAVFDVGLHVFGLPYLLAQVAATVVVLVWNFALARSFVFGASGK